MRHLLIAVAAAALVANSAFAQGAQDPQTTYKTVGAKAGPPAATIAYGAAAQQVADLRKPAGKGPFPVAVVIHGGCWRSDFDNRLSMSAFAEALGKRGFATWNIEYRRLGDQGGGWPGTFEDVAGAIDKLAGVAAEHQLDLSRVVIVGHSSGAHLALWAASRSRLPAPWSKTALKPASVVAIDGPAALAPLVGIDTQFCGAPVIAPFMGGAPDERPEAYNLASPANHLPLGVRQLAVEAELGGLMQPYNSAVRASGDPIEVLRPDKANHFDIVTPGSPNGEAVLDFIAAKALPKPE
jgi:acetyl esterase/lipase